MLCHRLGVALCCAVTCCVVLFRAVTCLVALQELAARGKPGKWTGVAAVMGRPRNACRLQWVKHFGDEAQALKQAGKASGHFSEEEEQRLREAYAAEKAAASTGQTAISWTNIGRAVGTRTGPECWSKWNRTEFGNTEEGASWSAEEDAAVLAGLEAEDADRWQGESSAVPHRRAGCGVMAPGWDSDGRATSLCAACRPLKAWFTRAAMRCSEANVWAATVPRSPMPPPFALGCYVVPPQMWTGRPWPVTPGSRATLQCADGGLPSWLAARQAGTD